jgi:hypothetical protein
MEDRVKTAVEGVADDVEVDLQDESNCILAMVLNQGVEEKMQPRELEDELFGLLLCVKFCSLYLPYSLLMFRFPFISYRLYSAVSPSGFRCVLYIDIDTVA